MFTQDLSAGWQQRPHVCSTEQMWALHDAVPESLQAAILLGAFAGLRDAEVCGLRVSDIDFMRGVVHPAVQYPAEALKTDASRAALPIPQSLAPALSAHVGKWSAGGVMLVNQWGDQLGPWTVQRATRSARSTVPGLPPGFRCHDLRHYLASTLIASGADVKVVQARLRHSSATTTLDTYAHLWAGLGRVDPVRHRRGEDRESGDSRGS